MTPLFFQSINVDLPRTAIYRRLGYRRNATRLDTARHREIEKYLGEAGELITLRGTARRLPCWIEPPGRVAVA